MDIINIGKMFAAVVGGMVGGFIGDINGLMYALLIFIALDYVSGIAASLRRGEGISSEVGFWGLVKKFGLLAIVGVGNVIDVYIIGNGAVFRTAVIFFFLANEGISLMENFAAIGVLVPENLKDFLAQLKEKK
jgi:toxin secretion/phage lysis holin